MSFFYLSPQHALTQSRHVPENAYQHVLNVPQTVRDDRIMAVIEVDINTVRVIYFLQDLCEPYVRRQHGMYKYLDRMTLRQFSRGKIQIGFCFGPYRN